MMPYTGSSQPFLLGSLSSLLALQGCGNPVNNIIRVWGYLIDFMT